MEVELRGITKRFGSVVANSDVNLSIRPGEVLGLLGENGAGKSTLMNILNGLYRADEGEILIDGTQVQFGGANEAILAGIGMVHQHFMLVPVFSVAENVILGVEPTGKFDKLEVATAHVQVEEICNKYGLRVDPGAIVEKLPVGLQQRVEIIKVLFRSAEIIIFDEPTAVLTPQEVREFLDIVRALRDAGKGIVFITHKLHEVLEIADRITILRGGKTVGEADPKKADKAELASAMVGRPVVFSVPKKPTSPHGKALQVTDISARGDQHELAVRKVSFEVQKGECVGIAGVQGNGQTELVEVLTGLRPSLLGQIALAGDDITFSSVRQRHDLGMAHVPEDRLRSGIIGTFTLAENAVLNTYHSDAYSGVQKLDWGKINEATAHIMSEFDVRAPSVFIEAGKLSGGNQQRLVVGRELSRDISLLIASQPTRGVDVGSIEYIHQRIIQARDEGKGVLIVSSELEEIFALSDRILVMYEGRIVAEFKTSETSIDDIGLAMAGVAA